MRRIAVLTSGGDAPGMNAAIRAVARAGHFRGWDVVGILNGFAGLIAGEMQPLGPRVVGSILDKGGTVLGSARCLEFKEEAGQKMATAMLEEMGVSGLIVIGGNGSQTGTLTLHRLGVPVVGVASTIDNDLCGTDITIGVDTALNVALESIDRLKTTASSHRRSLLVETMGRDCGYLALAAGIAGGAECIVIPEVETPPEKVAEAIGAGYSRGKRHALVVVAEGARYNVSAIAKYITDNKADLGFGVRTTVLGYVQRGGAPGAFDRLLASRFAVKAVECLADQEHGILVGQIDGHIKTTPLSEIVGRTKPLDSELLHLAPILAA